MPSKDKNRIKVKMERRGYVFTGALWGGLTGIILSLLASVFAFIVGIRVAEGRLQYIIVICAVVGGIMGGSKFDE